MDGALGGRACFGWGICWLLPVTGVAAAALAASAFTGVAAAQNTPTPTGEWSLTDTYDNVPPDSPYGTGYDTVTFTPTS